MIRAVQGTALCGAWFNWNDPDCGGNWCCVEPSVMDTDPCGGEAEPAETTATAPFTREQYAMMASDVLFAASGYLFPGECRGTVEWTGSDRWFCDFGQIADCPVQGWPPATSSCGRSPCVCSPPCATPRYCLSKITSRYPMTAVMRIIEDGVVLDLDEIGAEIRNGRICRTDAQWVCPTEIEVKYGRMPPPIGVLAAAELACELSKSCTAQDSCIPDEVTSVTAAGVTMNRADVVQALSEGRIMIESVQLFLMAYGVAQKDRQRGRVLSPDLDRRRSWDRVVAL